jgi:hypothetical protein
MSDASATNPPSGIEVLQARLWQAAQDLADGRITATEAKRITKERRDLRQIEAAVRIGKLARRLRSG